MRDIHDILKIRTNDVKPARGKILISEPLLMDYFFKRSVILLAEHNEEGTFGVIINKPVKAGLNEVIKDFPEFKARLFLGGPVQGDSLFFIHTLGDQVEGSFEIIKGVYWGGDIEIVKEMIELRVISPDQIRFFVGYSGWAPQQLDDELKRNSWVVSSIDQTTLLKTAPASLWKNTLVSLGGDYTSWLNFPDDPVLN